MSKQPNIVLLMADQHQADMMGCAGDPFALTPNIDRLAASGAVFERAYCQGPLCMPARASLTTERYVRDHGVFENASTIPGGMPTFLQRLAEAGYHTAEIGKMHLWVHGGARTRDVAEMEPWLRELGFAEPIETVGKLASANYKTPFTDYLAEKGLFDTYRAFIRGQQHGGGAVPPWDARPSPLDGPNYIDTWHGERTAEWIRRYEANKPFFLWVGFPGPHDPYDAPRSAIERHGRAEAPMPRTLRPPDLPDSGPFRVFLERFLAYSDTAHMTDAAIASMRRAYYGNVALIDDAVGRIVQALEDAGRLDETWVVYTSDHGELMGEHRMITKMVFYEPSVRVPLVVRPPGGAAARRVSAPVQLMDLAPSFREIAGAGPITGSEAKSLTGFVQGAREAPLHEVIIAENYGFAMFLAGNRKLVVYEDDVAPGQYFDLAADPNENENRIDDPACAPQIEEMMETLVRPFFSVKPLRPHPTLVQRVTAAGAAAR